ncbi:unnamed protein product [Effrenium voratum]|uniref:tRNA:m(4)X modification enzyme TRM13 n=1 Tax=Effrenium voratum TaxID=2562239 RepID=A0AA36MU54_9DINO|nr:unnamed protein product [Effrenium voratum]CAJ1380414.1 unnamed protein product [Effrenium voratum]
MGGVCSQGLASWCGWAGEARTAPLSASTEPNGPQTRHGQELSKRQQKKQVLRDARQERKGMKKQQKQVDSMSSALTSLNDLLAEHLGRPVSTTEALVEVFGTSCQYRTLPLAHGPCPAEGLALLGGALLRPEKYNAKFLPQEYSLLHKLWSVFRGNLSNAGVLDIGAGNANCAVLAAAVLGLMVICVERESPRVELRAEELLPESLKQRVIRVESDIADFDLSALTSLAQKHHLQRFALVAKHPCGIGVDRSIDCALKLRASGSSGPELLGVVIATCCTNKLSLDDFRASRVQEFCDLNSSQLEVSVAVVKAVELMSRCSAWRSASGSLGNAIGEEQLRWAEAFEA